MKTLATTSNTQAKITVDTFASPLLELSPMRTSALVSAMDRQMKHHEAQLTRLENELETLSEGYYKYMDVINQIAIREKAIERLKAIIGYGAAPYGTLLYTQPESPDDVKHEKENRALRQCLELWEAAEEYLSVVPEAKVKDILDFMGMVGIKASRQSLEASIKVHSKLFKVRKDKREKFISLTKRP